MVWLLPNRWLIAVLAVLAGQGLMVRAEDVKVTVLVILASTKETKVDREVEKIAEQVKKSETDLKGFRLDRQLAKTISVGGKTETFQLVENQEMKVAVLQALAQEQMVKLSVNPPKVGEITFSISYAKFLPIVTRYQTKDKERLILAIEVKPAKAK